VENNTTITLNLTLEQVNIVLSSLGEIAFRVSSPVIEEIRKQAEPQVRAAEGASAPAAAPAAE
jgi:hypothetical protein